MSEIKVERLTKRFNETAALDAVSLDFAAGSFTALLGPSGCGKTTMLRLIAGFEAPSQGRVLFGDELMADPQRQVPPEARGVGVVFQSYALWPHMDVAENVAYPLKARHVKRGEIAGRVGAVLDIVGLNGFESRRIEELSGGQRQRVALARCLVADAKIILFDEPLANLDMHLRSSMVDAFRDIHRRTGATIVYVTHDQAEALALADRVAIMSRGKVLQAAAPQEVYRAPANATVAGIVGRGSIVGGTVIDHAEETATVDIAGHRLVARSAGTSAGPVKILLRPEALRISPEGMPATVLDSVYRGPVHEVRLALPMPGRGPGPGPGQELLIDSTEAVAVGQSVNVAVSDAWIIPGA
ncbi:ABC transporter ATP-binding protein [Mesorhizobium mediterraneum]|uniref:Spermidine/putrescine ABC transporter ATP-binding protein n=1 Tax=Mesorhizobium mediterraneum TaxID=43617 RepID=A0AB36R4L9_9HYPH|nr:ABC transporter ATP-binding protein [Mesorhizobium mediterraneum]PAP99429.1 spermidine/putrescine ABC transporter ATP-binding protein [Mesorhizobium mediterraneum]RWN40194.1 MAG: ABC transporter ATP-binding protein [Mesorhizobium sp.]WIW54995.1 ABC transporter ATP-binding protein [Mesorhizobium mediterraneum]